MFVSSTKLHESLSAMSDGLRATRLPGAICGLIVKYAHQYQYAVYFAMFIESRILNAACRELYCEFNREFVIEWNMGYIATSKGREVVITYHTPHVSHQRRKVVPRDVLWDYITGDEPEFTTCITEMCWHTNAINGLRNAMQRLLCRIFIGYEVAAIARQRFVGRTAIAFD